MSTTTNAVLYAWGLFQPQYSAGLSNEQEVQYLTGSGFTTVILWTQHVQPDGTLVYNDPLAPPAEPWIVSNGQFNPAYQYLAQCISDLKEPGSSVTRVLFGIGSGGSEDFTNILSLIANGQKSVLQQNFSVLANALPIDGFDLDNEDALPYVPPGKPDPETLALISNFAEFTLLLAGIRSTVTYCPYNDQLFWFLCLRQVYLQNDNRQAVSWMNLQCYSGGAGNNPLVWAAELADWQKANPAGVAQPVAFVLPGYWCVNPGSNPTCEKGSTSGECPSAIQQTFQGFGGKGLSGGFIWNSYDIFRCMQSGVCPSMAAADYANAIIEGLGGG